MAGSEVLRINFETMPDEWHPPGSDLLDLDRVVLLTQQEIDELLRDCPAIRGVRVAAGSRHVGAEGCGPELLLDVERFASNLELPLSLGVYVGWCIRKIGSRRTGNAIVKDPSAHACIAAEACSDALSGMTPAGARMLDATADFGIDERMVFMSTFVGESRAVLVFTSAGGLYIGHVEVPTPTPEKLRVLVKEKADRVVVKVQIEGSKSGKVIQRIEVPRQKDPTRNTTRDEADLHALFGSWN